MDLLLKAKNIKITIRKDNEKMTELQLRTTEMFGEVQTNIYENENHEMFMTIEQLGKCLGYANGRKGVDNLILRNNYLKEEKFSVPLTLRATDNKTYSTRVFTERGIYEVTFLSNTSKAKEFHSWVCDLLISLRKGDLQLANGNIVFSPEMFETILAKYLGIIDNRILALETKKPTQPNFWVWKKQIANKAIDALCNALCTDGRTAYDMVYDHMTSMYGFSKSFAISQFCAKYDIENTSENPAKVTVIDAIADVPEYQHEFIDVVNYIIGGSNKNNTQLVDTSDVNCDRVQKTIMPLINKYNDNSPNGSKTYRLVYKKMGKSNKSWKNMQTRYHCKSKKEVLLKHDKYYTEFVKAINDLLSEGKGDF